MIFYTIIFIILVCSILYIYSKNKKIKEMFDSDASPCTQNSKSIACKQYICSIKRKQCYVDCFASNCKNGQSNLDVCTTCPSDMDEITEECANCTKICDATYILCKKEADDDEIRKLAEVSKNKGMENQITLYYCGEDNMTQTVVNAKFDYNFINPISNFSEYINQLKDTRELVYSQINDINEKYNLDIFIDEIIKKDDKNPESNFEKIFITYQEWRKNKDNGLPKVDGYFKNIYTEGNQLVIDDQIFTLFQKIIYKLLFIRNAYIELYPNDNDSIVNKMKRLLKVS